MWKAEKSDQLSSSPKSQRIGISQNGRFRSADTQDKEAQTAERTHLSVHTANLLICATYKTAGVNICLTAKIDPPFLHFPVYRIPCAYLLIHTFIDSKFSCFPSERTFNDSERTLHARIRGERSL
jgi:hypothetical protein